MNKLRKALLVFILLLSNFVVGQSCNFDDFVNDISRNNTAFDNLVKQEDGFKAWQILADEAPNLRTNLDELDLVSKNLSAIKSTGGYVKWKNLDELAKTGGFSKYATIDNWIKSIKNTSSKTNVENILKNWDEDLLKQLDNIPSRNPKFLAQVESNPNILKHFEEGSKIISNKSANLKAVELDMYALDKARTSDIIFDGKGKYITNPTRKSFDNLPESSKMDINTQSGKIRDSNGSVMVTDNVNSEGLMYVIDDANNIFIGGRNNASLPHPTLIGGLNPNVKSAGMIRFKDGRILEINNNSGHFKPSSDVLEEAERVFRQKLPDNSFDSKFEVKAL